MTAISERVARGHRAEAYYDGTIACYCDPEPVYTADRFAEHIAEVTEAATRESIAVSIAVKYNKIDRTNQGAVDAFRTCHDIARG